MDDEEQEVTQFVFTEDQRHLTVNPEWLTHLEVSLAPFSQVHVQSVPARHGVSICVVQPTVICNVAHCWQLLLATSLHADAFALDLDAETEARTVRYISSNACGCVDDGRHCIAAPILQ